MDLIIVVVLLVMNWLSPLLAIIVIPLCLIELAAFAAMFILWLHGRDR